MPPLLLFLHHPPFPKNREEDLAGADEDAVPSEVQIPSQSRIHLRLHTTNHLPLPAHHLSPAPSPTPPPPPPPSAPQRPIPPGNLHLHAKVYALGEKYGIQPLKDLALRKFESEAQFHLHSDDFLQGIREAYTSTVETDRPLRDAVVAILRSNKELLKKDSVKEVLKETSLGFDLLLEFASG